MAGIENNPGNYTNSAAGQIDVNGRLTNNGTFDNNGVTRNTVIGKFYNNGTFANNGGYTNNGVTKNTIGAIFHNNGTLSNSNSADFSNSGALSNFGTFTNNGGYTNTNYTGNALIGIFNNNGTLSNSNSADFFNYGTLTNNGTFINNGVFASFGTLKGTGTIVGNLLNIGIIAPGNSIGTMTITGNYTHSIVATYQVEANAAGQSDKLFVNGTATLNGGTVSVLAESGTYNARTTYTILTAGSVVGTFANVTSNLAFLTPSLSYDPTNVYLLLTRNNISFTNLATTPNQTSIASALDRISSTSTGDMDTVVNALLSLSSPGARSAYDQMGGLSHTSLAEAASFSVNRYMGVLSGRMGGFGTGGTAFSDAGNILLAFNENTGSDAGNMLLAAINSTRDNEGMKGNGMEVLPRGLWAKGYGNIGDRRGDDISTKYDYKGGGLIVGFDRKVSNRLLLGAAAGYSYTKVNMNSLNDDSRVASYQGSIYGAYNIDPWYVNGLIAYGYNRYDTTRNIAFGSIARVAHANYGGHSLSGYAETGYQIKTTLVNIIPMASLQSGSLWRNSFTESDAGALDLNAESDRTSSLIGSLGVKLRKEYKTEIGSLAPEFRVRWLHEFANSDYALNASFAGSPLSTFSVRGDQAKRDSAAVGAGLSWEIDRNFGLAFTYDATLSGDRTEHGGTAGIRYRW